ncbi:hypothetical protein [Streptomyces gibsoniae]|uniref:Uncharacterized protein n=1 Tax=Streptomyces gibsoniae TaxID=3075529 RepID=A0ABU2U6G7_9ACTN|nr:hypothetical protein [Streptomyces sp. DSM 41699]MDT0468774.1 hypothetical protein [Streptomyces sp. DSM 41699]
MRAWGEAVLMGPRVERLLRGVVRRVLARGEPHPWWLPRRVLTVVSADVDITAGVGEIWIVWRPKSPRMREHIALVERYDEQWRHVGGGGCPGDDPVDVDVLDVCSGGGVLSLTRSLDPPHSMTMAPLISCAKVRLGRDVAHVLVGGRRIAVPEQRMLIAVWASSQISRGVRPVVVALGRDGAELSRLGPRDSLDTYTWARLREES